MGQDYYVNSNGGDDRNSGKSPDQAWQSLQPINEFAFGPGDRVLLAGGSRYAGQLKPKCSGDAGLPIVIDRYGDGDNPRIDGEGKHIAAVHLYNVEYWEIRNLEITNTGDEREAKRKGVWVQADNYGTVHHIHLSHLYIHDVNGSNVKEDGGGAGIAWNNGGREVQSRFDGLVIEYCHLVRCDRCGISGGGYWQRSEWYPSLNVIIRGNELEDIGGDGIVPIGTDGCLVEYNTIHGGRMRDQGACAGIWPWSSDNTVIQYNEVSHYKGTLDGQGFDSDWNCRNTRIQYNYSHDNEGGFALICNYGGNVMPVSAGNVGTEIRYNVSINDQCRTFHIGGPTEDLHIHHNLVYIGKELDMPLVLVTDWGGMTEEARFSNNIFYADGIAKYGIGESVGVGQYEVKSDLKPLRLRFDSNLFIGNHVDDPHDPSGIYRGTDQDSGELPLFHEDGTIKNGFAIMRSLWGYSMAEG